MAGVVDPRSLRTGLIAVRWQFAGEPLPLLSDCVATGVLVRRALMSCAALLFGPHELPPQISRHDPDGGGPLGGGETGMSFLSEDCDGDGRIDHMTVHLAEEIDNGCLRTLVSLERLWSGRAGEWRVLRTWTIHAGESLGSLIACSATWVSLTPYINPLHSKPRRGLTTRSQLATQCLRAGLPAPTALEWLGPGAADDPDGRLPEQRYVQTLKGRPDETHGKHGGYWRLGFPQPVWGPLALGMNRHYGMGVFRPEPPPSEAAMTEGEP